MGRLLGALFGGFFALALILGSGAGLLVGVALERLERFDPMADPQLHEPLRIYTADGRLIGEFGIERRRYRRLQEIPPILIEAFIAAEDSRFFEHEGVDALGLARAALLYLSTGEPVQGGSTISMQLARNLYLSPEKTFRRKFNEILLAWHLERTLGKEAILELYLNKIFFGHRAYGVDAAAGVYYGKALAELTLAEAAMLAGLPKAPSANNPLSHPERARARRDYVLARLSTLGIISSDEARIARATPDSARLHGRAIEVDAGHAAELARQQMVARFGPDAMRAGYRVITSIDPDLQRAAQAAVQRALIDYDERHGYRGPERRLDPSGRGASVETLLAEVEPVAGMRAGVVVQVSRAGAEVDMGNAERIHLDLEGMAWARRNLGPDRRGPAPRAVSEVLSLGDLIRVRAGPRGQWRLAQKPAVAGALVAVSPADGSVLALAGGYQFGPDQFNRAVDARRPAGSSFKPFIYAAALHLGWTPASLVFDEPLEIALSDQEVWRPRNFDGRALGPIRLRQALVQSRNLAVIDVLEQIGLDEGRRFAERFGFRRQDLPRVPSLALGTAEVSPLRMASAYAVFANGGFRVTPQIIRRIENADGVLLSAVQPPWYCPTCRTWGRSGQPEPAQAAATGLAYERVLDPRDAFQMHSMLQDVIQSGTGRRARALARTDLAGKTGTTNQVRDSWFCGYHPDLSTAAWIGFDDFSPLGKDETGGQAAIALWMDFMGAALADRPESLPEPPPGLVRVAIDPRTGKRARGEGPKQVLEWLREEDAGWLDQDAGWSEYEEGWLLPLEDAALQDGEDLLLRLDESSWAEGEGLLLREEDRVWGEGDGLLFRQDDTAGGQDGRRESQQGGSTENE